MPQIQLYEFGKSQKIPLSNKKIQLFKNYLNEIWQNRLFLLSEDEQNNAHKQAFLKFEDNQIKARNYVGFIRFQDLEIHILPKIFSNQKSPNNELIFRHLLYYLSYSNKLKFPFSLIEADSFQITHLTDLFAYIFVRFVQETIQFHPYKCYVEDTEQNAFLKGKFAQNAYLQNSLGSGNWQNFYSTHESFAYNNLFNQILKNVCRIMTQQIENESIVNILKEILFVLDEVSDVVCTVQDCQKVQLNSLLESQQVILNFCKLYLQNAHINQSKGFEKNFAFLLPMERIYEDFIANFLQSHFPTWQWQQQTISFFATTSSENKQNFQIKNDLYLPEKQLIIDTKYKIRKPTKDNKTGISSTDMYQMISYGLVKQCQNVLLIYPTLFEENIASHQKTSFVLEGGLLEHHPLHIQARDLDITLSSLDRENFNENLDKKIERQLEEIFFNSI